MSSKVGREDISKYNLALENLFLKDNFLNSGFIINRIIRFMKNIHITLYNIIEVVNQ